MGERKIDRQRFYGAIWRKVRSRVLQGQPKYCYLCAGERGPIRYDLKYPHPLSPSVDHVIPAQTFDHLPDAEREIAMYDISNLKPCHKVCNDEKSNGVAPMEQIVMKPVHSEEW